MVLALGILLGAITGLFIGAAIWRGVPRGYMVLGAVLAIACAVLVSCLL